MPVVSKFYNLIHGNFKTRLPKLYCYCEGRKSFLKFFMAGSLAGTTDLIFLFLFYGVFDLNIVLATSLAFLMSFAVSFYLQKHWTFKNNDERKTPKQVILYFLNAFLSLNINAVCMHFLVNELHVPYLLAQIMVNLGLGGVNYIVYKSIIFRNEQEDEINCEQEPADSI